MCCTHCIVCVALFTSQMPPLCVEVGLVGQAALHHVAAVVGAGPCGRHAAAVGAVGHPHHGPHALQAQLHLWTPGGWHGRIAPVFLGLSKQCGESRQEGSVMEREKL